MFALVQSLCTLLVSPQLEEGKPLPSPNALKGKILIKNKKLKPEQEAEGDSFMGESLLY